MSDTFWDFYYKAQEFDIQPDEIKKEILDVLCNDNTHVTRWAYAQVMITVVKHVDIDTALNIVSFYFKGLAVNEQALSVICELIETTPALKEHIYGLIKTSENHYIKRALLILGNYTVDEEETCLRSLAKHTHIPVQLYDTHYTPSKEALNKLPTIMRLKLVEAFLEPKLINYNIFKNLTEEEFKNMLFGSVMRYRDRVSTACEKYKNIKDIGGTHTIKLICNCIDCGPIELTLTSKMVHTKGMLRNTKLNRVAEKSCPICGKYDINVEVIE